MSDSEAYLKSITDFAPLFDKADYADGESIDGSSDLRHFIPKFMYYSPAWLVFLYKVRGALAKLMGLKRPDIPNTPPTPEDVSFTPGDMCQVFTVTHGKDNQYIAVAIDDTHLLARILVAAEQRENGVTRFHVGTTVEHQNWKGPVYMTLIKPFHHMIVRNMMAAGIKP